MIYFYYLVFSVRQYTYVRSGPILGEFQALGLILWIESSIIISFSFLLFRKYLDNFNPYFLGVFFILPLAIFNEFIFSKKKKIWVAYQKKFSALPSRRRHLFNMLAALFVITSVLIFPVIVRIYSR
jgi:drug/metabolite transporter (DMT)-like permease